MEIHMRISWKIRACVKISRSWKISMLENGLITVNSKKLNNSYILKNEYKSLEVQLVAACNAFHSLIVLLFFPQWYEYSRWLFIFNFLVLLLPYLLKLIVCLEQLLFLCQYKNPITSERELLCFAHFYSCYSIISCFFPFVMKLCHFLISVSFFNKSSC